MGTPEVIKKVLKKTAYSEAELAREIGVHRTTVRYYRLGEGIPGSDKIRKIIAFAKQHDLELTPEDFRDE